MPLLSTATVANASSATNSTKAVPAIQTMDSCIYPPRDLAGFGADSIASSPKSARSSVGVRAASSHLRSSDSENLP